MLDGTAGKVVEAAGTYSLNPFGATDMSFEYQFNVTAGVVEHLSGASFKGYMTDVVQVTGVGPLGVAGTVAADGVDRTTSGTVVKWNYTSTGVGPGGSSYMLIVNTNVTDFGPGSLGLLDGGSAQFTGFAPAPEPASMILFLGTLAGLAAWSIHRRFKVQRAAF
jgi:hypothetical protein